MVTQLPGGWLASKFGGKYVIGVGVLMTSLLTIITPQMAYLDLWALVACRVVTGLFDVSKSYLMTIVISIPITAGINLSIH